MGFFDKLDRLDERALGRFGGHRRPKDPAGAIADSACRASAFLRRHPMVVVLLILVDVFGMALAAVMMATAPTESQAVIRGGQLLGGVPTAAMLLLLRAGRLRYAVYAGTAALSILPAEAVVVAILKENPLILLAIVPLAPLFAGVIYTYRLVPDRCFEA